MIVLRNIFGPSRKMIWQQLSEQIGARYIEGGFWKGETLDELCRMGSAYQTAPGVSL